MTCVTSYPMGSPVQLLAHKMKSSSISLSVYRTEYHLQWIGKYVVKSGISQVGLKDTNRVTTKCKTKGVTIMNWNQNNSAWMATWKFQIKDKILTMQMSVGKVLCTLFWDRKGMVLLDFMEFKQAIKSDHYITDPGW